MIYIIVILLFSFSAFGQYDYWPEVLTTPEEVEQQDSNHMEINLKQNIDEYIYETDNSFSLLKNDSLREVKQFLNYKLADDNNLGRQNHYLDVAGSFSRKKFPFSFSSLGFEWIPTATFYRLQGPPNRSSSGVGSIRVGPSIGLLYQNLPFRISGGGVVDVWQDNMSYKPKWDEAVASNGDPGFYTALTVGNNNRPLFEGIPFYSEGKVFGRYMNSARNEKITNGEINALFLQDIPFGDTLFLYAADTLSKGREGSLSGVQSGSIQLESTPNKTHNSLQASIGIKNINTKLLTPSLLYQLSLSSVTFPPGEDVRFNERFIKHSVALMARNNRPDLFVYRGGIQFEFEDEDWVFNHEFKKKYEDTLLGNVLRDSLKMNTNDFKGFRAGMYHHFNKKLDNNMEFTYTFNIDRYKVTYPFYFIKTSESQKNDITELNNDKDEAFARHVFEVTLFSLPRIKLDLLADYSKNDRVNLKKERSYNNFTERVYRFESTLFINPDSSKGFTETFGAFSRMSEYHYPEFHDKGPPLFRQYYSQLRGWISFKEKIKIEAIWNDIATVNGLVDFNHILRPELRYKESSLDLNFSNSFPNHFITQTGCLFRYIKYYTNIYNDIRIDKSLWPYIGIKAFIFNKLMFNARLERYINPEKDDFWKGLSTLNWVF